MARGKSSRQSTPLPAGFAFEQWHNVAVEVRGTNMTIAYVNDDHWNRLSHVAIWNTRQTEFGKEMPFAGRLSFGGMLIGPPAETTYLRLSHRVDPNNGEHEFRAATRREGGSWIYGGTWTLPAGTEPRIGLISHGKSNLADPTATSRFDYFRVYQP